jgi:hypothetical protein
MQSMYIRALLILINRDEVDKLIRSGRYIPEHKAPKSNWIGGQMGPKVHTELQ